MQITTKNNFYRLGIVAAVAAFTAVACNDSSDYKTSDKSGTADSSTVMNPAASSTPAGQPAAADMDTVNMGKTSKVTTPVAGVKGKKRASASIVYTDKMAGATLPEFPGGQRALDNYVNDHINYPQDAVDNDISGIVRVSFVVDENGKISKAKLVSPQRVGNGLDEEALRVVNTMPEWKPATVHGKKIKTRLELPISFQVES